MENLYLESAYRLGAAWLAGCLIGFDRSYHEKPAGFRTHSLVCVASALLMLVTAWQWDWVGDVPMETLRADPQRMAQGIMTGIGFLGAGAIFLDRLAVRGLTTAASVWITAAIGILYGAGMFYPALLGTVITLVTLALLHKLENRFPLRVHAYHRLRLARANAMNRDEVRALLQRHQFKVVNMSYRLCDGGEAIECRMTIRTSNEDNLDSLAKDLLGMPTVREFRLAPTGD
jgi:putative Mg2+ transporter-C (MgtC) family protein